MPNCLFCGIEIPEGRQICPNCEHTPHKGHICDNYETNSRTQNFTRRTIAVDFDGTLCTNKYPEIGEPISKTIQYIRRARSEGHIIVLWTCRNGEQLNTALEWCKKQGLIFDFVNENATHFIKKYGGDTRKINADIYIDDKAADINSLLLADRLKDIEM